jgi:hypothetical protein
VFQAGQTAYQEAERQEEAAGWPDTIEGYYQARQLFTQAAEQARLEQARRATAEAQAQAAAKAAQKKPRQLERRNTPERSLMKLSLIHQGEEAENEGEYDKARQKYGSALAISFAVCGVAAGLMFSSPTAPSFPVGSRAVSFP